MSTLDAAIQRRAKEQSRWYCNGVARVEQDLQRYIRQFQQLADAASTDNTDVFTWRRLSMMAKEIAGARQFCAVSLQIERDLRDLGNCNLLTFAINILRRRWLLFRRYGNANR